MTVGIHDLNTYSVSDVTGYRLINAKFPPIALFDDAADAADFEVLYALQALTNPRIQNEVGEINLLPSGEIPFGIRGCNYAVAPFTHVNPDGSRFSDGDFGLLYVADTIETAIAEVRYHQGQYWANVPELHYDRFVFKVLVCNFAVSSGLDATPVSFNDPIYSLTDYSASRHLGISIKQHSEYSTLKYHSVRNDGGTCHASFTPKNVKDVVQAGHYEMIWSDSQIQSVNALSLSA